MKKKEIKKQAEIQIDNHRFTCELVIPMGSTAMVLFCHGSGSSRFSPRNQAVANYLNEHGIGTLLFDLLTPAEDQLVKNRFDIDMISERLVRITSELINQHQLEDFRLGYFGASTGAAAALRASIELPDRIQAIVCRGGRPDLAIDILHQVQAPTLYLVGEMDQEVIELNDMAYKSMNCASEMMIVPGATHLFEEPGTLNAVAEKASDWFNKYLVVQKEKVASEEETRVPELMEEGVF